MSFIEATFDLPYYEPGTDLENCKAHTDDGVVDVRTTLSNHINMLRDSIRVLEDLRDAIPNDNTLDIFGQRHTIGLSGDNLVINELIARGLARQCEFVEEEESDDNINVTDDDTDDDDDDDDE